MLPITLLVAIALILLLLEGADVVDAGRTFAPTRRARSLVVLRGGSTDMAAVEEEEEEEQGDDITKHPDFEGLQKYRLEQQMLLQLRSTYLSEALARRGLPIPTLEDVATPAGDAPPAHVDWDCALSTEEDSKSCLLSYDAEPDTKVVAPLDTDKWISLGALNRLRRTDPSKVEGMWNSQYSILKSWFDPESEYSMLQHVGFSGFLLNALLQGYRLNVCLVLAIFVTTIVCMPTLEYFVNRVLVSSLLWMQWPKWARFIHAALPLQLLLGQMAGKGIAHVFDRLVQFVKTRLVALECHILEQHIPLTVDVPTPSPPPGGKEEDAELDVDWLDSGDAADEPEEDDVDE